MWLVVGLGNPGARYERNRHNIGFRVVDRLAANHRFGGFTQKLGGDVATGTVATDGEATRCVLLKPIEYMNRSGFAVQRTAQFHKIERSQIVVVHDEIDLPFGLVRLKSGGGHGGHNGLRSIIEQLGDEFARVRMGVGRDPNAPPQSQDAAAWVLSDFWPAQAAVVDAMLAAAVEDIECVLANGIGPAMNRHNARPQLGVSG